MKIAIISDTHDNLATVGKFLAYISKNPAETIIHCGDIAEGDTLKHLADNFNGKILAVLGNMDYKESLEAAAKKIPNKITLFKSFGQTEAEGLKIGFTHHKETGLSYCQKKKFDYIFYGHTHKPWLETIGNCQFANPGNLAGMFYKASFATLDTENKKLELKIVERL